MTNNKLTDERICWLIDYVTNNTDISFYAGEDIVAAMRELQERRRADNAEPVAWIATYHGEVYDDAVGPTRSSVEVYADNYGWEPALTEITPLYTAPPAPVVPDECPAEIRELMASHSDNLFNDEDAQEIWNACRAAILNQQSNNQTSNINVSGDEIKQPSGNDVIGCRCQQHRSR